VDADKMSRVSVFEGDAKVSASGKAVAVHEGFGTRVAKGKPPEPPEPLPVAPTWLSAAPGPRILVGAATAQQTLSWEEGAAAYRLQVSHDSAFNDLLLDEKPSAERTRTVALPPGRYFTRVWAINAKGMAGPPGPVWTLDVLAVKAEGATPGEGGFHAPGPVKLNIDAPPGVPVFLDGKALASGAVTVSEPGKHELTAGSAKVSVEIAPPPPPPAPPPVVVAPPPPPPRPPPALTSYVQSRVAAGPLVDPWRDTRPELELSLQSIGGDGASGLVRAGARFEAARVWAEAGIVNAGQGGRFAGLGAMVYLHEGEILSLGIGGEFNGPISGGSDPLLRSNVRVLATAGARIDRFAISTTQAAFAAGAAGWNGNLAASYRLAGDFFAQASVEGATVRAGPANDKGGALVGGLRYGDGMFDISLAGRAGLYGGGRDLWSPGSVLLSLRWSGFSLPAQPEKTHKWVPPY
jgi:hypothetical protein